MPFLRDFATVEQGVKGHTTASMPTHEAGDLLLWIIGRDTSSGSIASASQPITSAIGLQTPTGWTKGDERTFGVNTPAATTNTVRGCWFFKIATSTSESAPATILLNSGGLVLNGQTGSVDWHTVMMSIGAVNTTAPINASSSVSWSHVLQNPYMPPLTSSAVTTTTNNCMIIFACINDGGTDPTNYPESGQMHILGQDSNAVVSVGAAWGFQATAGLVESGRCKFYTNNYSGDETVMFTIAVANTQSADSVGTPAYVDYTVPPATLIDPFTIFGTTQLSGTYPNAVPVSHLSLSAPRTNLLPLLYDAAAATADYGLNPYHNAIGSTPAITTGPTSSGFNLTLTSSGIGRNFSSGAFLFSVVAANPRDYIDLGKVRAPETGLVITFFDNALRYRSYHYGAQLATPDFRNRMLACVQPTVTSSVLCVSTGTLDTTKITRINFSASDPRGATAYYFSQAVMLNKLVVCGGTASAPVAMDDLILCGQSYPLPYIEKQGAAGALSYIPIQIGGAFPTYADINASALQFPRFASETAKQINFHVTESWVGISYKGLPGYTIKHRNSVIASPSKYYWKMDPWCSASATYDFSGLTIVGADPVELVNVMTYSAMTFNDCAQINAASCSLLNCTISAPRTGSVSSMLITSGTTLEGCTFIAGASSDYALELRQTASYNTFTGLTFTGFTKDLYITPTGGAVTISIGGGGSTPTYMSKGALVLINNFKNFEITGLVADSEVRIYNANDDTELAGIESSSTSFTYQYNYTSDIPIYVVIFSLAYKEIRLTGLTLGNADQSIPIQQQTDRVYSP